MRSAGIFWNEKVCTCFAQLRSIEISESRSSEVGQFFFVFCFSKVLLYFVCVEKETRRHFL